jgi:uncharacterized repeat protein (TIGR01451 family)
MNFTLPPGSVVLSATPNYGSCTTALTCTVASLPPSREPAKIYMADVRFVAPPTPATYQLGSQVSWTNPGFPTDSPRTGSGELTVVPRPVFPDLALLVDATPAAVTTGDLVTYTLHVTNAGTGTAASVSVRQTTSKPAVFVTSSVHCSTEPSVSCLVGTLASGAWSTLTITERLTDPGDVTSAFTVTTSSAEDHVSNNTATATVTVVPPPVRRRATRH